MEGIGKSRPRYGQNASGVQSSGMGLLDSIYGVVYCMLIGLSALTLVVALFLPRETRKKLLHALGRKWII